MSLKKAIYDDYKEFIALEGHRYPQPMIEALRAHERVPGFLDRLVEQMAIAEVKTAGKLKRETIKMAVYDMTRFFLTNFLRHAEQQAMSDMEKRRIRKEAEALEDFRQEFVEEDSSQELEHGTK